MTMTHRIARAVIGVLVFTAAVLALDALVTRDPLDGAGARAVWTREAHP